MSDRQARYRINYTIERTFDNYTYEEIGFGSSGSYADVDAAIYAVQSDIQNGSWETGHGMPDPSEVRDDR